MSLAGYRFVQSGVQVELNERVDMPIEMSPRGGVDAPKVVLERGTIGKLSASFKGGSGNVAVKFPDDLIQGECFVPATKLKLKLE